MTTVIIPIGAIPSRISSAQPIEVARNCFVNSSPNRVSSGAKSLKALFAKFAVSTLGRAVAVEVAAAVVVVVAMMNSALGDSPTARVGHELGLAEGGVLQLTIRRYG